MAAFIWDMDGTLVDSYFAIVPAVLEACGEFGLSFSYDEVYAEVIRTSVGAFIKQVSTTHNLDPRPIQARFDDLNDSKIDMIRAAPHAVEALKLLSEAGHSHFVFTHRGGILPIYP